MTVSFAVMAHKNRRHFVGPLCEAIGGDVSVVWDKHNDRIDTGDRALAAYDPAATHHVVIQDDGIVCANLRQTVERLVELVPDNPISLYTGRTRPKGYDVQMAVRKARRRGLSWIVLDELYWGVGVVLPVRLIEKMREFHAVVHAKIANWDSKMSFFFSQRGIKVFYTQPSLVDHRDASENPSLVPGRWATGRVAHWFADDAGRVDWETRMLHMNKHGKYHIADRTELVEERV